ncbi:hypothetical protein SESBI_30215 [Sesbania bispinosa]|nr:hypothetical protein SESBI_30215 [Sesbania bispinosa]
MKREGRQHGMVRTFRILPSPLNPKPNTRFDSPPTAGLFTKVPSKPTNHSKFTGKCGTPRCSGCHFHPVCKSKSKTKAPKRTKIGGSWIDPIRIFPGCQQQGRWNIFLTGTWKMKVMTKLNFMGIIQAL